MENEDLVQDQDVTIHDNSLVVAVDLFKARGVARL